MDTTIDDVETSSPNIQVTKSTKEEDALLCFVCDMEITGPGRFYSLATCRAQKSKSRIIEKLGQLVGDQYMVVIAEDDIICRGCATVVNTLDRLECEMGSLRSVILRFLEKKYGLPEGELVNQKPNGLGQETRIVPSTKKGSKNNPLNSMARKRQAALQHLGLGDPADVQQENVDLSNDGKDGPDKWIQCNKCKYTTKYSSFLHHHLRGHSHDGDDADCDFCAPEAEGGKKGGAGGRRGGRAQEVHDETSRDSDGSETVEMIAAEINEYAAGRSDLEQDTAQDTIKVQIVSQGQRKRFNPMSSTDEKEVTIEMPEIQEVGEEGQISKMDEDDTVYVQMVDVEQKEDDATAAKQVLTVGEDGTVEMVEVTWDEMHAADSAARESAQF